MDDPEKDAGLETEASDHDGGAAAVNFAMDGHRDSLSPHVLLMFEEGYELTIHQFHRLTCGSWIEPCQQCTESGPPDKIGWHPSSYLCTQVPAVVLCARILAVKDAALH